MFNGLLQTVAISAALLLSTDSLRMLTVRHSYHSKVSGFNYNNFQKRDLIACFVKRGQLADRDEGKVQEDKVQVGQNQMKKGTGAMLIDGIGAIFNDRTASHAQVTEALTAFVAEHRNSLNHAHAATMMQRSARAKIDITKAIPINALITILRRASHRTHFRSVEAAHCVYGLRMLSEATEEVLPLVGLLSDLCLECNEEFKGQEMGNALFGLQKFTAASDEVRKLLAVLAVKFKFSSANMSTQELSNSLFGLRMMSSSSAEVLSILDVITEKLKHSKGEDFGTQAVGNSLNGLQSMTADSPQVKALLTALVPKIERMSGELNAPSIGAALMGLKGMTSDVREVQQIVGILADKISLSTIKMDTVSICSAVNGMRGLHDKVPEVRRLLSALAGKIEAVPAEEFDPTIISNVIFGLKSMSGVYPETKRMLTAINSKLTGTSSNVRPFRSSDIGRSVYGLQSMSAENTPEVRLLIAAIADGISKSNAQLNPRDLSLAMYGLKSQSDTVLEVRGLLSALATKISATKDPLHGRILSMAMLGLQEFSGTSKEVRQVLAALTPRISSPLDTQGCGNILYSMKLMTSEKSEVRKFLSALAPLIESCEGILNGQELANAYFGLQGMDSVFPEVRAVLSALNKKLRQASDVQFTAQGVGNAISGLQTMTDADGPEINEAISLLTEKLESCPHEMEQLDLSNALFGLQGLKADTVEVKRMLLAIAAKMRESTGIYSARDIGYSLTGLSSNQPIVIDEVREVFEELCMKVSLSEFQGQPDLLFLQFGKGIRVKRSAPLPALTLASAQSVTQK